MKVLVQVDNGSTWFVFARDMEAGAAAQLVLAMRRGEYAHEGITAAKTQG